MMRDYSSDDAETREPAPPAGPSRRSRVADDSDDPRGQGSPQVLARIPSLASEDGDYDDGEMPAPRDARHGGSKLSLKILAMVGAVLFGAALWGFVFDKNRETPKDKDTASANAPAREPFKPETPAPATPVAPRWSGNNADAANWQAGAPIPGAQPNTGAQPGASQPAAANRPASDRWSNPAAASVVSDAVSVPSVAGNPPIRGTETPAAPATGSDLGSSWMSQPYPNTANRPATPAWDAAPAREGPGGAAAVARRDPPSAANRSALYTDANDSFRDNPAAFSTHPSTIPPPGTIQGGPHPSDPAQGSSMGTRPSSLGDRRPIEAPDAQQGYRGYRSDYPSDYRTENRPPVNDPTSDPRLPGRTSPRMDAGTDRTDHRFMPAPDPRAPDRSGASATFPSGAPIPAYSGTVGLPGGVMPAEQRMPSSGSPNSAARYPGAPMGQQPAAGDYPNAPGYSGAAHGFRAPLPQAYPNGAPSYVNPQGTPAYAVPPSQGGYPAGAASSPGGAYPAAGAGYPFSAPGTSSSTDYGAPPTSIRPTSDPYAPQADAGAARFEGTISRPDSQVQRTDRPRNGLY